MKIPLNRLMFLAIFALNSAMSAANLCAGYTGDAFANLGMAGFMLGNWFAIANGARVEKASADLIEQQRRLIKIMDAELDKK